MPAKASKDKEDKRITPIVEEVADKEESGKEVGPTEESTAEDEKQSVESNDITPEMEEKLNSLLEEKVEKRQKKSNFKLIFFTSLLTALVVGLLAGGLYVYFDSVNALPNLSDAEDRMVNPVPSETPSPTETAETAPQVNLGEYSVQVLNGSGVAGAAGSVASMLEEVGFEDVAAGNASRQDYENTVVEAKESVPASVVDSLHEALSDEYSVETGEELPDSASYDIIVTVGQKK